MNKIFLIDEITLRHLVLNKLDGICKKQLVDCFNITHYVKGKGVLERAEGKLIEIEMCQYFLRPLLGISHSSVYYFTLKNDDSMEMLHETQRHAKLP